MKETLSRQLEKGDRILCLLILKLGEMDIKGRVA